MKALLCLVTIGLALFAPAPQGRAGEYDLEIITPHNEDIQAEFERAFVAKVGHPLKIRWIKKGTGQVIQQLEAQDRATPGGSFDLDVFFGGGVPDHELAASRNFLEAAAIPDDILKGIPEKIAGVAMYNDRKLWFGSALAAFGVLVNQKAMENQKLPPVAAWEDLADARMFSWVIVADPRKSSSVRVAYELILQQYGWETGWPLLMRIVANSRTVSDSSSAIPNEIGSGNAIAGPCIDFYAYARIEQTGGSVLAYIFPKGGSAITPDPISMLRKPPHKPLAEQFIAFVLSPEGQRLWILPRNTPGGPTEHALFRMPVRPDVCKEYADKMLVRDPFKAAEAGVFRNMDGQKERARTTLVAELMGAALVDLHSELKETWKALIDGGMKPAALAEWNRVPFSEAEGFEIARKLEAGGREARRLVQGWQELFREKFARVRKLAK